MYNGNYNNPYFAQMQVPKFQPMPQSQMIEPAPQYVQPQFNKQNMLLGKSVDSIDVVKATDVPFDGSISYFPLTDGSAIVTKQLQNDGTSKIVIFKPLEDTKDVVKYITQEDLEKALDDINLSEIDDIKDDIKEIKKQLKDFKKKKED